MGCRRNRGSTEVRGVRLTVYGMHTAVNEQKQEYHKMLFLQHLLGVLSWIHYSSSHQGSVRRGPLLVFTLFWARSINGTQIWPRLDIGKDHKKAFICMFPGLCSQLVGPLWVCKTITNGVEIPSKSNHLLQPEPSLAQTKGELTWLKTKPDFAQQGSGNDVYPFTPKKQNQNQDIQVADALHNGQTPNICGKFH